MKRHILLTTTLLMISAFSGCGTMMYLLGDPVRYSISGRVQSSASGQVQSTTTNEKRIPDVSVSLDCPGLESTLYRDRTGLTNETGHYALVGYYEPQGCEISFTHSNYYPQTIEIDKNHLISAKELSPTYEVNARLEPKPIKGQ
jgi:hypothetical protein